MQPEQGGCCETMLFMAAAENDLITLATPWIDRELSACGRLRQGPVTIRRARPWALVASLETDHSTMWFKANHEAFRYEATVLTLIDGLAPDTVLSPVAHHPEHGWFLADDGGPTAAEQPECAPDPIDVVDVYLRSQRASVDVVRELQTAGVPSREPSMLLELFDRAVAHPLAGNVAEGCASWRSRVVELIAQLGSMDMVISNSDLKPSHVFVGPPVRLFDWGDAVLTHPLMSCGTILDGFGHKAVHHYVAAWGESMHSPAVDAGLALTDLIKLDVWLRDPPAALDRHPGQIEKLLTQLANKLA